MIAFKEQWKELTFSNILRDMSHSIFRGNSNTEIKKNDSGGIRIVVSNKIHYSIQVQREQDSLGWITTQGKYLSLSYDISVACMPSGESIC